MEWFKGNALTVGDLKKALEGLSDDAEVGQSIFGISGHISKVTSVLFCKEGGILVLEHESKAGTFSNEEVTDDMLDVLRLTKHRPLKN